MFRRTFAVLVWAAGLALAQPQVGRIEVLVAPDHPDWKYAPGEAVTFTIRAVRNGADVPGAQVTYSVGPEAMPPVTTKTAALGRDGLRVDGGTLNAPGFLRCIAKVRQDGYTYQGLATAAFAPESIQPAVRDPEDFEGFWQSGKDELAKVPVDARRTLIPELSTAAVNVYHVSLQNVGRARVFGMLAEPKAPGRYPAVLSVPGAGVHKIGPLMELAERGAITLAIGIHGIPLTLDAGVYAALTDGALNGYWAYNLDSRDRYYYRRVYLGCIRANDYLTSLPNWNGRDLAVTGGSQGGALSIVTAALDPRVKALAASYPALSDMAGYTEGRAGGWPHVFRAAGPGSQRTKEKLETAAYYDVVNFARRVKAAGIYTWGYNDQTCPPTSMYAAYNVIRAPKQLVLALETGHGRVPEQADILNRWLEGFLRTGQPASEP
jgi:cephalosporin-C deacetylase